MFTVATVSVWVNDVQNRFFHHSPLVSAHIFNQSCSFIPRSYEKATYHIALSVALRIWTAWTQATFFFVLPLSP